MKKALLFVAIASAAFLVACKKDRVCTCTVTPVSGTASSYTVTYYAAHKKDARILCTAEATEYDLVTPTAAKGDKTTCELK
jgi:hypothetical protein